jgi:hypothetical protein
MSLPFLKTESEETATQAAAFIAVCIITIGLATMNVMGVLAGSQGASVGQWIIRISLAIIVCGAELLAAVILVRVMLAPNWWRRLAGALILIGVAWACIQNGKRAVHLIYPEFAESAALLEAKAGIAGTEAGLIAEARSKAIDATPQELARVRTDIAALKAEQQLMSSQSPEKVKEAQSLLIAQGKYFGRVDGIRAELTEAAMRSRGEEISRELTNLGLREEALAAGAVTAAAGVAAAATNPAVLQADLADRARKAREATIWVEVMLWVFELARTFGLWALVTTITAKKNLGAVVEGVSDDVPPGFTRVEVPTDEWEAMLKAKAEKDKRSESASLRARIPIGHKEWMRDKKKEIADLHSQGISAQDIYEQSGFVTWFEFENFVRKVFNAKAAGRILGTIAPEPDDPRAAATPEPPVAVMDSPQPEPEPEAVEDEPEPEPEDVLEIPPEPKEWGIAVYDADLKQDDNEGAKRDEMV